MSLFVTTVCQVVGDTVISQGSWSNVDNIAALTAFTIDDNDKEINQVVFANNEGELMANFEINHDYEATVMQWHPSERVLALGWGDGMLSTWVVDGKSRPTTSYTNTSQHHAPITVMKWNPNGKRLVTGDKKGIVCVWSADSRGVLSIMRQYKRKGEITQLVFCTLPTRIDMNQINSLANVSNKSGGSDLLKVQGNTPSFFFGTDRGALAYADDMGNCTDIQTLSSPVESLLFFTDGSYLLLITRSMLLITYHIAQDGKINKVNSVKLSIQNPDIATTGLGGITWVYAGIFAMATEEKILRLYDVVLNEGYNLSLSSALGADMDRSDRVTTVAFDSVNRNLCVGTQSGWVIVYKYCGMSRDLSSLEGDAKPPATASSDWEVTFKAPMNSPVSALSFHPVRGFLSVITEDQALFLTEAMLHSFVCGDACVIQVNSHELHVQIGLGAAGGNRNSRRNNTDESTQLAVNTGMQLRGVAMTYSAFVVWTNKVVKVYRLDLQSQQITPAELIKCPCAMAVIADSTFIVEDVIFVLEHNASVVKILNYGGVSRGSIPFTEQEGQPVAMHINNKFLCIVTNRGCVKVFDIHTPTKAKLLGSAGTFHIDMNINYLRSNKISSSTKGGKSKLAEMPPAVTASSNMKIRQVRVNCTGTMIAILIDKVEGAQAINYPDTVLYIYDRNKGSLLTYNFNQQKRYPVNVLWDDNDERLFCCEAVRTRDRQVVKEKEASTSEKEGKEGDVPPANGVTEDSLANMEVYLMFATPEKGLLMQDSFPVATPLGSLMGFSVPFIHFKHDFYLKQSTTDPDDPPAEAQVTAPTNIVYNNSRIVTKLMRDFAGIDDITDSIRGVLLDFSYYMTLGKLDEAYRVIKDINSVHIWENMAQMCVKTRRLDVAEVCLSHMGNLRGLEIIKEYRQRLLNSSIYLDNYTAGNAQTVANNTLVVIGILAIQLGLLDDAVAIFKEVKRYDLLNKLYQDAGLWKKAIRVAENYDRMHLKTTYHNFAKYLESNNNIADAMEYYKLAEIDHVEVPRMLFYLNRIDDLNEYIIQSDNILLLKWWASYLESIDRMDKAKKYYQKANDHLSLVRIACFKGDFESAAEVINESGDRASSYHFARQLEHQNEFQEAINFYALSGCYHHCIRLAKAHELDGELMRYALKSTPAYMISCAEYYEQKGEFDKAIQLYYKGSDISYALELCFRIGEDMRSVQTHQGRTPPPHPYAAAAYDMINTIAQELGVNSSPQLLARCADFLVSNRQFAKAIELYIMAKKHYNAIEICVQHKIPLNDEIIEQLTPKEDQVSDANERKEILKNIGKLLKKQGLFMQASKKFTQAGDRVQAMKCLVKHGDNKLVVQFANISRNRDIYVLAANYLQQMNWREDIDTMKHIILFYNKAKAYVQLSNFYEHCATVEVDDYQDYAKALSAYNEALKYLNKLLNEVHTSHAAVYSDSDIHLAQQMSGNYEQRMMKINKFLDAKKAGTNSNALLTICDALLQDPDIDEAVRMGDIFSLLIDFYVANRQYNEAFDHLKEMQGRKINVNQFVDAAVVEEVYKAVGRSAGAAPTNSGRGGAGEGKERDEDLGGIKMFDNNSARRDEHEEDMDEEIGEEVEEEVEEEESKQQGRRPNNARGYNTYRK